MLRKIIVGLLIAFTLFGCSTTKSKYPTSIDEIQNALQNGSTIDSKLARKLASNSPPAAVQSALLASSATAVASANSPGLEPRFNVAAQDVPAQAFFMSLVQGTKLNMIVGTDIKGTISMNLKNVTLEEALAAVRDNYGYDFHRTSYGYEVMSPGLQTRIFTVSYLDVKRTGDSTTSLTSSENGFSSASSSGGSGSSTSGGSSNAATGSVNTVSEMDFWKSLTDTLTSMIGNKDGRSIVVNSSAGVVIINAYPQELYRAAQYLSKVQNSMQRQVTIEAKILEVQLKKEFQAGIDWTLLGAAGANGASSNTIQSGSSILLGNSSNSFLNSFLVADKRNNFEALISLLEQQGNVQTLSNPRVSTMNNEKAVIKVGGDTFYVTNITTTPVTSGTATTASTSLTLTPFFSGITLDVTPQISSEGDITLQIHPTISDVTQQTQTINLGTNGNYVLPLAASKVRETDSIVHAKNGQIIILGGLMQNNTQEQINATPLLGRIPFLGALFRTTDQASTKTELVILLRPIVVDNNMMADSLAKESKRFKALNRGFHAGSLPEEFGTEAETFTQ